MARRTFLAEGTVYPKAWGCENTQYVLGLQKQLQKPQDGWSCHKTPKDLDNRWEAFGAKSFHEAHLVGFTEVDETGKKVFTKKEKTGVST